jgi:hypothetical protein
MMGATIEAGIAYPSGVTEFTTSLVEFVLLNFNI